MHYLGEGVFGEEIFYVFVFFTYVHENVFSELV